MAIKSVQLKDFLIVSISQPYIRPIVRGKAKSPVEFGAKLDLSVDETGMCRIEKLSFDAYNESAVLKTALENYKKRTGHYPERVLADQIYRNRDNIAFCSSLGIWLSGKKLGRRRRIQTAKLRRKSPIRIIPTELKWSGSLVSRNANSVWVCCLQQEKIQQKHRSFSASLQ